MAKVKMALLSSAGKDVEELEVEYTVGWGDAEQYSYIGKVWADLS